MYISLSTHSSWPGNRPEPHFQPKGSQTKLQKTRSTGPVRLIKYTSNSRNNSQNTKKRNSNTNNNNNNRHNNRNASNNSSNIAASCLVRYRAQAKGVARMRRQYSSRSELFFQLIRVPWLVEKCDDFSEQLCWLERR